MSNGTSSKSWICSLVAVAFVALGISGLLMLFHINIPAVNLEPLHIVMGIVFIVAGVVHLALNWKTFVAHFGNRSAIIAGIAAVVVAAILLFIGGPEGSGPHRYGQDQEELGIVTDGDFDNGSGGDFDNGSRGFGPGGRFGNGRWGDSGK